MSLQAFSVNGPRETTEYSCGFLINKDNNLVALVRKEKPTWQHGLLNGIGGKIEEGESPTICMVREFREEALNPLYHGEEIKWDRFASIRGNCRERQPGNEGVFRVHFFRAFASLTMLRMNLRTNTSEQIIVESISNLNAQNCIPNVPWLLRMALDIDLDAAEGFEIVEHYLD